MGDLGLSPNPAADRHLVGQMLPCPCLSLLIGKGGASRPARDSQREGQQQLTALGAATAPGVRGSI